MLPNRFEVFHKFASLGGIKITPSGVKIRKDVSTMLGNPRRIWIGLDKTTGELAFDAASDTDLSAYVLNPAIGQISSPRIATLLRQGGYREGDYDVSLVDGVAVVKLEQATV